MTEIEDNDIIIGSMSFNLLKGFTPWIVCALILIVCGVVFSVWSDSNPYVVNGSGSPEMKRFVDMAVEQNNPSLCSKLIMTGPGLDVSRESLIDECFREVAILMVEPEICAQMSPEYRYQCYTPIAIATHDFSLCEEFGGPRCIKRFAQTFNDITLCEKITIPNLQQDCRYGVQP